MGTWETIGAFLGTVLTTALATSKVQQRRNGHAATRCSFADNRDELRDFLKQNLAELKGLREDVKDALRELRQRP